LARLCVAGLRAEADAGANPDAGGGRLMERLWRLSARHPVRDDGYGLELDALRVTGEAELARLLHQATPDHWQAAIDGWERIAVPYPAAYAHLRLSEALLERGSAGERQRAGGHLRAADARAARLGARPLRHAIAAAAHRGGIAWRVRAGASEPGGGDLRDTNGDGATSTFAQWAADHELTAREQQVLRLIVRGSSNREIGDQLYIAESTASVHVSRILRKLGVRTRAEAIAQVLTSGMLQDESSG